MATYVLQNVVFTAAQEMGFDMILFKDNARRVGDGLPARTKQQFLDADNQAKPANYLLKFRQDFKERCGTALETASSANLQSVATTLSVDVNPYD